MRQCRTHFEPERGRCYVHCVLDPAAPDSVSFAAAVRLARLTALATLREAVVEVDTEALSQTMVGIRQQLGSIKGLKATLTSMGKSAGDVSIGLDRMRDAIVERVLEAESELRADARTPTTR